MNLQKSTLVIPLAAAFLVAGAGAVVATTGAGPGPAAPVAEAPTVAPIPTPTPSAVPLRTIEDAPLVDALDSLVANGTITADQKTKILDAVTAARKARAQEVQADRQARRVARQADRQVLKDALADGVITQDELDKLSADNPLRQATGLMDDGKITLDELRSLRRDLLGGRGRGGLGLPGKGAPSTNPTPSPAAGGTSG